MAHPTFPSQDLKSLRNADPKAFKEFLKRPPPAEVAAEIQAVLKASEDQQKPDVPVHKAEEVCRVCVFKTSMATLWETNFMG